MLRTGEYASHFWSLTAGLVDSNTGDTLSSTVNSLWRLKWPLWPSSCGRKSFNLLLTSALQTAQMKEDGALDCFDLLNHGGNTSRRPPPLSRGKRGVQGGFPGLTWKCLPWALCLGLVFRETWPMKGHTHNYKWRSWKWQAVIQGGFEGRVF